MKKLLLVEKEGAHILSRVGWHRQHQCMVIGFRQVKIKDSEHFTTKKRWGFVKYLCFVLMYANITWQPVNVYKFLWQFKQTNKVSCGRPDFQDPCHTFSFGKGWSSCNLHALRSLPFSPQKRYSYHCTTFKTSNLKESVKSMRIKFCQNGCFGPWDLWWLLCILNTLLVQAFLRQPVGITYVQTPQRRIMLMSPCDFFTLRSLDHILRVSHLCLLILIVPLDETQHC